MLISEIKHSCGALRLIYYGGQESLHVPYGVNECDDCLKWSSKRNQKFMSKIKNSNVKLGLKYSLIILLVFLLVDFGYSFLNPNKEMKIVLLSMFLIFSFLVIIIFFFNMKIRPEIIIPPSVTRETEQPKSTNRIEHKDQLFGYPKDMSPEYSEYGFRRYLTKLENQLSKESLCKNKPNIPTVIFQYKIKPERILHFKTSNNINKNGYKLIIYSMKDELIRYGHVIINVLHDGVVGETDLRQNTEFVEYIKDCEATMGDIVQVIIDSPEEINIDKSNIYLHCYEYEFVEKINKTMWG